MGIVIRPKTPKSAPEAKIERIEDTPTKEVGMKKCKLCEEEHPAKSFKKYEGVEMCEECYAIEKEGLEDDKRLEELCVKAHTPAEKEKATKEVLKPMEKIKPLKLSKKEIKNLQKEVCERQKAIYSRDKEVKVKSSGKPIGEKIYTKIVEFQGSWGPVQQMFLIATDPRFFEPDSKIKPLALGGFKASLLAKMMSGEVEGPTIFEYVEKHASKYMGGK